MLGDGECSEGAVWEAMAFGSHYNLDNLVAIIDANRLGQSEAAPLKHDMDVYRKRCEAFGSVPSALPHICGLIGVSSQLSSYCPFFFSFLPGVTLFCVLTRSFSISRWNTYVVDGHDVEELCKALWQAQQVKGKPTMILAKTFKGRGLKGRWRWEGCSNQELNRSKRAKTQKGLI